MFQYLPELYLKIIIDAWRRFQGSLILVPAQLVLFCGYILISIAASPFGILRGLIVYIAQAAALTFYLGWLRDAHSSYKVRWRDLKEFDWGLFQGIISILFILWIFEWVLKMLTTGMHISWPFYMLQICTVILLNSLPESLYISRYEGLQAVEESFNFTQRNYIEWFIPYLVIFIPIILYTGLSVESLILNSQIFYPPATFIMAAGILGDGEVSQYLFLALGMAFAHFYMLFRARLYLELESGNRRQRLFRTRQ